MFKATVGFDSTEYYVPFVSSILGNLEMGTIMTGIGFLLVDPKISDVVEMYLLIGVLPLAITLIINALHNALESKA